MKKIISLAFMLFFCSIYYSQINQNNKLPTVMPPSPSAYEFLKYGDIPLSNYTGVPNISVPLYTIKARGLNLDLNLQYHSNGFKVSEEAGWTGLGWSLNPGGNIVQIVQGLDDFGSKKNRTFINADAIADIVTNYATPNGALTTNNSTSILEVNSDDFYNILNTSYSSQGEPPNQLFPLSLVLGDKDYEPDIFQFNLLGYSGKFLLDWDTETFVCLTNSRIKVQKINSGHSQISIRTPEGHIGYFSLKEEAKVINHTSKSPGNLTVNDYPLINEITSRVYKLDSIVTNKNDTIQFFYTIISPKKGFINSSYQVVSFEDTGTSSFYHPSSGLKAGITASHTLNEQELTFLNKIIFNKGVLIFNTSSRQDINGALKLDEILLKENEGDINNIKQIVFNYDYFIGHNNGYSNEGGAYYPTSWFQKSVTEKTHRLKLNSVSISGQPNYIFDYNTTQLPSKTSYAKDYWGYYNGYLNNANAFINPYRFDYNLTGEMSFYSDKSNNNRSSNLTYTKAGILKKITYPTGGYSEFEYELNSFINYKIPNYSFTNSSIFLSSHVSYGAGLRIKRIKHYSSNGFLASRKLYSYEDGKSMTPIKFFNKSFIPRFDFFIHYNPAVGNIIGYASGYRIKQSANSFYSPSTNASGNFVGYSKVIEHVVSKDDENLNNGTIEYYYENHTDQGIYDTTNDNILTTQGSFLEVGLPTFEANLPRNGSLKKQIIKDKFENSKSKTINTYQTNIRNFHKSGVKFGPLKKSTNPNNAYGNTIKYHSLGFYPIRGIDSYLTKTESTNYEDGDSLTVKSEFKYNSYLQLTEKKSTNSDGSILEELFTYEIGNSSQPSLGQISKLTSEIVKKNGKVSKKMNYEYLGENLTSISDNLGMLGVNSSNIGSTQFFVKNKNFLYDTNSNIIESSENIIRPPLSNLSSGLITKYIWDYFGKYPIVKLEGYGVNGWPSQSTINALVNASQDYNNQANLLTQIQNLRNSVGLNVLVTSYTYKNLVGVTSITNPRGQTVYYEYDSFNRLKYIKDKDGYILSRNDYNFKN